MHILFLRQDIFLKVFDKLNERSFTLYLYELKNSFHQTVEGKQELLFRMLLLNNIIIKEKEIWLHDLQALCVTKIITNWHCAIMLDVV